MAETLPNPSSARHPELSEIRGTMVKASLRKAEIEDDDRKMLGRAIVRARSLLGWSLKQLAAAVSRDPRQVHRWEQGDDRDRAQLDALWAVEEMRGPLVIALAEAADDSAVVITTHIAVRQRKAR